MSSRVQILKGVYWAGLVVVFALFLWAGLQKAIHLDAFCLSVYRYHLFPEVVVNWVAFWVVGLELICAFFLFIPLFRLAVLWVLFFMLLFFTVGIGVNLVRNVQMGCGCFSSSPMADDLSVFGIVKNVGLIVLLFFLIVQEVRSKKG